MEKELLFPDGFLWGAASSSYQVEGGVDNCNWSESSPAGRACDFWNSYERYFDIAKELNHNIYRLSLEWSRIEPQEGQFDRQALEHYKDMLKALKARGIKTMVTLWHYTHPIWFEEKGGWTNFSAPEYFGNYVSFAVEELDSYVDFWVTINEPMISVSHPFILGAFPPKHKNDFWGAMKAMFNYVQGHRRAYRIIKGINPDKPAGMAENYSYVEPYHNEPQDILVAKIWDFVRNGLFIGLTKDEQDFIGVNYYFHERLKVQPKFPFFAVDNENESVTDTGWEIYPRGLYEVIKKMGKYGKPIYITENGLSDKEDKQRCRFIEDHLVWVHKAIEEGADVRSYLYWSLLDDFEWEFGYSPRFGLVGLDFETLETEIRPSARRYAQICKSNKLSLAGEKMIIPEYNKLIKEEK